LAADAPRRDQDYYWSIKLFIAGVPPYERVALHRSTEKETDAQVTLHPRRRTMRTIRFPPISGIAGWSRSAFNPVQVPRNER
jgi:hypothetical protein